MSGTVLIIIGAVMVVTGVAVAIIGMIYSKTTAKKIKNALQNEYFFN